MAAALRPGLAAARAALRIVDIDADPALKARFDWDVPLLCDGESVPDGAERCPCLAGALIGTDVGGLARAVGSLTCWGSGAGTARFA